MHYSHQRDSLCVCVCLCAVSVCWREEGGREGYSLPNTPVAPQLSLRLLITLLQSSLSQLRLAEEENTSIIEQSHAGECTSTQTHTASCARMKTRKHTHSEMKAETNSQHTESLAFTVHTHTDKEQLVEKAASLVGSRSKCC